MSIISSGASINVGRKPAHRRLSPARAVARRLGLHHVDQDDLTWRRARRGKGFCYLREDGSVIRHSVTIHRLAGLAVPPAYEDVRYAADAAAHLQAIGRDAAGRLQYRYHPEWQKVRETRKARRLVRLAEALPKIRRSVAQHLSGSGPARELAFAAVIELIARSAIRPGNDDYTKKHRSHGATTLLKSHVSVDGAALSSGSLSEPGATNWCKRRSSRRGWPRRLPYCNGCPAAGYSNIATTLAPYSRLNPHRLISSCERLRAPRYR